MLSLNTGEETLIRPQYGDEADFMDSLWEVIPSLRSRWGWDKREDGEWVEGRKGEL